MRVFITLFALLTLMSCAEESRMLPNPSGEMKKLNIFILLILMSTSCVKDKVGRVNCNSDVKMITVGYDYNNELQLDTLFSSIAAIKLETKKECLIGNPKKVVFYKDRIYIRNEKNNLFVFSNSGDFIQEISNKGRGPGEYHEIRDFQIGEDNKVYILDYLKILVFSLEGEFLNTIKFKIRDKKGVLANPTQLMLSKTDNSFYLWSGSVGIKDNSDNRFYAMYKINSKGHIINKYFPLKHIIAGNSFRYREFKEYCNIVPIFGNDTVYSIVNDEIIPRYFIDFGKRAVKQKIPNLYSLGDFKNELSAKYSFQPTRFIEMDNWIYFNFRYNGFVYNSYFSKEKEKTYISKGYPRVENRITPYKMDANIGNKLISVIDPIILMEDIKKRKKSNAIISEKEKELQASLEGLSIGDNPVILVCTLQ